MIGINTTILDGAQIGDGTMVAAHALVREGMIVPQNSLVVDVPTCIIEDKGRSDFIERNAISYYIFSRTYISGEDGIPPDELMKKMQTFTPEE